MLQCRSGYFNPQPLSCIGRFGPSPRTICPRFALARLWRLPGVGAIPDRRGLA